MSLISFTPLADGVTAVDAAATNTPLSTIYNDYNGNITNDNISTSAAISSSKIAPLISTQSNTGTAAGTIWWTSIGSLKLLWIATSGATSGATTYSVAFPTFFTNVQSVTFGIVGSGGTTNGVYIVNGTVATSGFSYYSGTNPHDIYFSVVGN